MFLNFEFPPLLYYIRSGPGLFEPGRLHMHNKRATFFDLLVVFEGKMFLWEAGKEYEINKGEFLILEPGNEHYGSKSHTESTFYYWAHFQATGNFFHTPDEQHVLELTDYRNVLSIPKKGKLQHTHLILDQLKALENLHTYSDKMYKHQQQIIFQQLIPQLMKQKSATVSQQVERVAKETARFLEESFREEISYDFLSQQFNFTSTYITRCFKKIYGMTPLAYLNKIRLEEAKFSLRNTDLTIEKIAFSTGFNSISYFSRAFAKALGMPPIQYRKFYQKVD